MSESTNPLDAVIAEYLQAVERGHVPNRQDLLDHHPALSDDLRAFFAQLDHVDQLAAPLRLDPTGDQPPCPAPPDRIRYFGDYELLEEIARGGMGIVYKARQTSLNRIVALKMILKGTFATPRDVARFRAEAESAANLDHPNIVPIHEVGEHDGHQYYTMRFIEGRPLNQTLRANPRSETEQMVTIARAVHYAHQRGILHRDLKPSNILMSFSRERQASADSPPALASRSRLNETPFVVDFGLAKRLDANRSLTESGQIIGTPRYMAPEQAAGRKDLTIAADVYSLGVILYERLTGRTPFTGDDPLTILRQVRELEPPRPSSITPGIDHDLQTAVLKCLEKEPAKRYASAAELADDLERWLRGEPILARPVGQAERFRRWCKRNPAVAGLTGAVAAALIIGTVASTFFAVNERWARKRAEGAETDAINARDELEGEFARSFLKPLNPDADQDVALNEPETEALWTLATQERDQIRWRFLAEATRDSFALRQMYSRAEPSIIAAIGLDLNRRAVAAELIMGRLRDIKVPDSHKVALASLACELEDSAGAQLRVYQTIIQRCPASEMPASWASHLQAASQRWEPAFAAEQLADMLGRGINTNQWSLAEALHYLAPRLEPADARRLAVQMAAAVIRDKGARGDLWILARALSELATRLEPTDAQHVCASVAQQLADALGQEMDGSKWSNMASQLFEVAPQLEAADARPLALQLSAFLMRIKNARNRYSLYIALTRLAARLAPADAQRLAQQLADGLSQETDRDAWLRLVSQLSDLATRLEPVDAERLAQQLADALKQEKEFDTRNRLARAVRIGSTAGTRRRPTYRYASGPATGRCHGARKGRFRVARAERIGGVAGGHRRRASGPATGRCDETRRGCQTPARFGPGARKTGRAAKTHRRPAYLCGPRPAFGPCPSTKETI